MNNTTRFFKLNKDGVCNFCEAHDSLEKQFPISGNEKKIAEEIIKKGKNKKYDCVLGLSGGRDSTYLVSVAKRLGLRPLLVHFNDGFGNPTAGENIKNIIKKTNFELRTITSDWRESRDIKISCMKASVPDMQIGMDLGIATALYSTAAKENINYILGGVSFRTEGVVPLDWNYLDGRYLKSIMKNHGTVRLKKWKPYDPGFNFDVKEFFYYSFIKKIKYIPLLYHLDYQRPKAEEIIKEEFNWKYPGAHYFDDLFQSLNFYILRKKFKIDYRRFNYSALVRANQYTRDEALKKVEKIYEVEDEKIIDLCVKRLGLTQKEINHFLNEKPKSFLDYDSNYKFIKLIKYPIKILCKLGFLPPSLYLKFFT